LTHLFAPFADTFSMKTQVSNDVRCSHIDTVDSVLDFDSIGKTHGQAFYANLGSATRLGWDALKPDMTTKLASLAYQDALDVRRGFADAAGPNAGITSTIAALAPSAIKCIVWTGVGVVLDYPGEVLLNLGLGAKDLVDAFFHSVLPEKRVVNPWCLSSDAKH
jgi:hypothetical protein